MFNTTFKALAVAALVSATGTAAYAADHIFVPGAQDITSEIDFDLVRATTDGVISIYAYHKGEQGVLLGTEAIRAGANQNVEVILDRHAVNDVIAVLTLNGQSTPVAVERIDNLNNIN